MEPTNEQALEELKVDAKECIEGDIDWLLQFDPEGSAQIECFAKICFAIRLKLITNLEAAEYCRKIGIEKAAEIYEKYAAIKEAIS